MSTRHPSPDDVIDFHEHFNERVDALREQEGRMSTVVHINCTPRVVGLTATRDANAFIKALSKQSNRYKQQSLDQWVAKPSLIDGGANICATSALHLLIEVVELTTPMQIVLAQVDGKEPQLDDCCTAKGFLPIRFKSGKVHYQLCYYCKNMGDTIISPQAIINACDTYDKWTQVGYKDGRPGHVEFSNSMWPENTQTLELNYNEGLYYCSGDCITEDEGPLRSVQVDDINPRINRVRVTDKTKPVRGKLKPTSKQEQLVSEVWSARFGFPSEDVCVTTTKHVTGVPSLCFHPFHRLEFKDQAGIKRQPATRTEHTEHVSVPRKCFNMDFGFMRASAEDYTRPDKEKDRIVESFDGFNCYLIIVDEASRFVWVFLSASKEPPLETIDLFLTLNGHKDGGYIRTDQGGELAKCKAFKDDMLKNHNYVVEPTGADSPSQNGGAEKWNDTLAVTTRALLYSSGLHAKFWSAALVHAVYLHNRRVHSATKITPYEGLKGKKPDLRHLRTFGSRVCVKRTGHRRAKLDKHDFRGIFLGYTATDKNIRYIDLDSGIVKTSHHAVFDEAWYLQQERPPAAQMLYDLGLECEDDAGWEIEPEPELAPYPPMVDGKPNTTIKLNSDGKWPVPSPCKMLHLPLRNTARPVAAAAAKLEIAKLRIAKLRLDSNTPDNESIIETFMISKVRNQAREVVEKFHIKQDELHQVYMSPTYLHQSFEEDLNLRKFDLDKHLTAGLQLQERDGKLLLLGMEKSTPAHKIPRGKSRVRGAYLLQVNGIPVKTVAEVNAALAKASSYKEYDVILQFSHPEIRHGLSNKGIPIVSREQFTQLHLDQLNNRWQLPSKEDALPHPDSNYSIEHEGGVRNMTTRVMKLTRKILKQQDDWNDWRDSEWLQLDQYDKQGMFGKPVKVDTTESVFYLVWTYVIKTADKRKKARCTCDGSTRAGQVRVLDETYANCVDQTSSRLFHAIAAAENLLIFGSDVSNAFAEASAPKQGFYIRPDQAFHNWWVNHKGRKPIPKGYVIPVQSAMQGHPESPRLWEKHADRILRKIGLQPAHHEPCLYSGIINGKRVVFKRQVDDFAAACPDAETANILFDMIDDELSIPLKRQGLLEMFNGVDILQSKYFIKINVKTYLEKVCEKYLNGWMKKGFTTDNRPVPLPADPKWLKLFNETVGDPDKQVQAKLMKEHGLKYRAIIGEIIYAMTVARPDVAYSSVKLSQFNVAPADIHYRGAKHTLRYLYETRDDGIYYWRPKAQPELPEHKLPQVRSNYQDLLWEEKRPEHKPLDLHVYADSDWATCPLTRRSVGGFTTKLAGGTIGYKCKFHTSVATSSTHAEFMSAHDAARNQLYIRSVMWDLDVPQEAATIIYEDNDAATAMGNARKPSTRTRHIDIKYFSLCEWIEQDMIRMERIDTKLNEADNYTKPLSRALFHRHADHIMGRIVPRYSPVYQQMVGNFVQKDTIKRIPSFTTPTAAAAAKVYAPVYEDVKEHPWAAVLWHS